MPEGELDMRELGLVLQRTLRAFGRDVTDCMPGQLFPCGTSDADHVTVYLICVKAFCDYALRGMPPALVMDGCERERRQLEEIYGA